MATDRVIHEAACAYGYPNLKAEQKKVLKSFIEGKDVFVSLPTGYGKSLCYALLPSIFNIKNGVTERTSICLIVSPLVALMKDQSSFFTEKGISAAFISDKETTDKDSKRNIRKGEYQLVFVSPEALFLTTEWRGMLSSDIYRRFLVGFIVDEAHCVKKWGDSFRREFSRLGELRSIIPEHVHVMALTATATVSTRKEIIKSLDMQDPVIVSVSPMKGNIHYCVARKTTLSEAFRPICEKLARQRISTDRMIVFCQTYDDVTSVYYYIKHQLGRGFTEPPGAPDLVQFRLVDMYTHCTHQTVKDKILTQFTSSSPLRLVIATVAFGMGIDCPDVRQVIHWGVPEDAEMYVQETGRAGRDGLPACALLFPVRVKKQTSKHMRTNCANEDSCRRLLLFSDFDGCSSVELKSCKCCDICKKECMCGNCDKYLRTFFLGNN